MGHRRQTEQFGGDLWNCLVKKKNKIDQNKCDICTWNRIVDFQWKT